MTDPIQVEPAASVDYVPAIRFIAGAGRRDWGSVNMADAMIALARSRRPGEVHVWWARKHRSEGAAVVAAAMAVANPGRVGVLFYSSATSAAVQAMPLAAAMAGACRDAMATGLSFVQTIVATDAMTDINVLQQAGLSPLAELLYMRKDLRVKQPPSTQPRAARPQADDYRWLDYNHFDDAQLAAILRETYQQSLDCPAITGLRTIEDVIASYKSSGNIDRANSWLAMRDDRPAGIVLANDFAEQDSAEIAYLGAAPWARGKGLGRILLRRAVSGIVVRGRESVTLAVDAANTPALDIYYSEGFVPTARRLAYAMKQADLRQTHSLSTGM